MTNPDLWFVEENKKENVKKKKNTSLLLWGILVLACIIIALVYFYFFGDYFRSSCFSSLGPQVCENDHLSYYRLDSVTHENFSVVCYDDHRYYRVWERVNNTPC